MEVTLVSYNSPTGRCQDCPINTEGDGSHSCCDDFDRFSDRVCDIDGHRQCDPYFTFCLRPLGNTGRGCSTHRNVTSRSRNERPSIDFDKDHYEFGLPNPLHLPGLTKPYSVCLNISMHCVHL